MNQPTSRRSILLGQSDPAYEASIAKAVQARSPCGRVALVPVLQYADCTPLLKLLELLFTNFPPGQDCLLATLEAACRPSPRVLQRLSNLGKDFDT
jgi:hypothetical protein